MKAKDVQQLDHGLYRIYWKSGGTSLAAVGSFNDGSRWLAPTNWVNWSMEPEGMAKVWRDVKSVIFLSKG